MSQPMLGPESFRQYPPLARQLAAKYVAILQQLPVVFLAVLLREISSLDWQFPLERRSIEDQLQFLGSLPAAERERLLGGFASVTPPQNFVLDEIVQRPQEFMDTLTAHLWSTGQIAAFDQAASEYVKAWHGARPDPEPIGPRLCVVMLEDDVRGADYVLFRKLRPHGVLFSRVDRADAWKQLLAEAASRCSRYPGEFQHWFIDGAGTEIAVDQRFTKVSWQGTRAMRERILAKMRADGASGYGNAESTHAILAKMTPTQLGVNGPQDREVLAWFQVKLLTEGSGTQVFSTTFVQWTAREVLRRAQPCTVVLRYGCRRRELPMNELLLGEAIPDTPDPEGSLVDADMGAFYTWVNLQRLSGSRQASFLVWSMAHGCALAISPALPRGSVSPNTPSMKELLSYLA